MGTNRTTTLKRRLTPNIRETIDLGNNSNAWRNLYVREVYFLQGFLQREHLHSEKLQIYKQQHIIMLISGVKNQAFEELYVKDAFFSGDTITIGEASLSSTSGGGVLLPLNSSIGTEDNEIPANFANTLIEERFAESVSITDFTFSGSQGRKYIECNGFGGDATKFVQQGDLIQFSDSSDTIIRALVQYSTQPEGVLKSRIYLDRSLPEDVSNSSVVRVRPSITNF